MRILFSKTAHAIWVSAALLSECGPASAQTVVATGLSNPSALAVDSGYLYFGQLNGSQGYLSRVPRMGGPTENLVYNTAFLDSGTYRGVERIGFTSNKIYFGFGGYVQYEIDESEKNGTALRSLANPSGGTFVGTVGTNIYYLQGFCCITKLPTDGSTGPQTAASGNWVRRVVTDDTSAYFYEYNTREIRKFEAISETVTTLILTQAGETAVAIDQSNVYADNGGTTILQVSKQGGQVSTLYTGSNLRVWASDGSRVYFTEGASLKSISIGGGAPVTLVQSVSIDSAASADGVFYWSDSSGGAGFGKIFAFESTVLPVLQVLPGSDLLATGSQGGPFVPSSFQYQLSTTTGTANFLISGLPNWLYANFTSGAATPSPLTVTFSLANVVPLTPGVYNATVSFSNTDNGLGNTVRAATLTVEPLTVDAQVENLRTLLKGSNIAGGLEKSLDAKLRAAIATLQARRPNYIRTSCNQLGAFIQEAVAQTGKGLSGLQASQLTSTADRALDALGCGAAAIAFDNATQMPFSGSGASISYSTGNRGNRALIVCEYTLNDTAMPPTYAGVPLTLVTKTSYRGVAYLGVAAYLMLNPPAGTHPLAIWTSQGNVAAFISSYSGVSQIGNPDSVSAKNVELQSSIADVVTTTRDNDWLVMCESDSGAGSNQNYASSGMLRLIDFSFAGAMADSRKGLPSGSNTLTITANGSVTPSFINDVLIALKPAQ